MSTTSPPSGSPVSVLTCVARAALADDLAALSDEQWRSPSLCSGWTVEQTLAHLTSAARMTPFRWVRSVLAAGLRADVHNRRRLAEHLGPGPSGTLERFREVVPSLRAPSRHAAAWLGEVLVHGQDVRRPLGLPGSAPVQAWTVVARFYAARNFAVDSRTVARGLRLVADDGPFAVGSGPQVVGSTEALVMAMAGRAAYLPELSGPGASFVRSRITGTGRR
ncbi:maleylpyruvate isomerase family mycothiol-dependent enzyme [Kineococcus sp. SYSU DK003]|uniref:maleylpyruvate isomerase family mycothiol-dependent enzyme n=1 Tax=Kineococcus sp. SYSU DK003 TaxID=3383124 RepID=UPI003D7E39B0